MKNEKCNHVIGAASESSTCLKCGNIVTKTIQISSSQLPSNKITDADIEAWAESKEPFWRTDVDTERYYRGRILGAKAMRDNLIKKG